MTDTGGDLDSLPGLGSVANDGSVGTASIGSGGSLNSTWTADVEESGDDESGTLLADFRSSVVRQNAEENKLRKKSDQEEALKKLGNVARVPFNRAALNDQMAVGERKLKNVVSDRGAEIAKEERRFNVIYNSVTYFKRRAAKNLAELKSINEQVRAGQVRTLEECELEMDRYIEMFDENAYMQGNM